MEGSWLSPLAIAVITVALQWPQAAATFPAMPLSSLFANAERSYIPEDQRHTNKNSQVAYCYSETIPAPTGKEDAQQKSDMELLRFSLVLIQSWLTPVQYLSKVFTNNLVFGTSDRVYEKLKDLEEGIQALMRITISCPSQCTDPTTEEGKNTGQVLPAPLREQIPPGITTFQTQHPTSDKQQHNVRYISRQSTLKQANFARFETSQHFINTFYAGKDLL
ncbi:hypothetical protein EK904_011592 [Melospiza melodia maxima]|nr:hypothetical protein EK904_011592 [Melospiza melodia maxima]